MTMTRGITPFLLAAAALLAGCGGSDSSGQAAAAGGGGGGGTAVSLQDIAVKAGCQSITADSDELYVREGGTCTAPEGELIVETFTDAKNRDAWLEVAKGLGGIYVVGDRWVVSVDDQAAADAVKGRTGGEVQ